MNLKDIDEGMRLSMAEGWNQTERDWQVFVENSSNFSFIAEYNDKLVATTAAMNYGNALAWIGMVLVDREYRGRGISKLLLSHTLQELTSFQSIKLDATAAGQPVYEKFGFKIEYLVSRMVNTNPQNTISSDIHAESIYQEDVDEVVALDEEVFGANRRQVIELLIREHPDTGKVLRLDGRIIAFALGRKGRKYFHIGPLVAGNVADAKALFTNLLSSHVNEAVVVDVLYNKSELVEWLHSIGFSVQRQFVRMYKEENPFPGNTGHLYLICGPEFG